MQQCIVYMKETLFLIGGGNTFDDREQMLKYFRECDPFVEYGSRYWHEWILWSLGDKYNTVKYKKIGQDNADYEVWKIVFEKQIEYLKSKGESDYLHIVAHSLGTIFILKYLIENTLSFKLSSLHLVAPIVAEEFLGNSGEGLGTFRFDTEKLGNIKSFCNDIHVWHSKDDTICKFQNAEMIVKHVNGTKLHEFEDRGHFVGETFLELFDVLRAMR